MIKKVFLLFIFSFFIATINGCSTLYADGSGKASPVKRSEALKFEEQKNYSQLYIVREGISLAGGVPLDIYASKKSMPEKKIGALGNFDEYFHLKFEPGNYTIKTGFGRREATEYPYKAVAGALDIIFCDAVDYVDDEKDDCLIKKITSNDKENLSTYTLNHAYQQVFKTKKIKTVSTFEPEKTITVSTDDDYYTAYRRAESTDTLKAYQSFLRKHPKGMYTTTVKRRISQLQ